MTVYSEPTTTKLQLKSAMRGSSSNPLAPNNRRSRIIARWRSKDGTLQASKIQTSLLVHLKLPLLRRKSMRAILARRTPKLFAKCVALKFQRFVEVMRRAPLLSAVQSTVSQKMQCKCSVQKGLASTCTPKLAIRVLIATRISIKFARETYSAMFRVKKLT